jgi:hypothetical protein
LSDPIERWSGLALDHPSAKQDRDQRWRTRPGKVDTLQLTISGTGRTWKDGDATKLESHMAAIVVQLILAGEGQYRGRAKANYEHVCEHRRKMEQQLVAQRAEALRVAREKRIKAEQDRRSTLLQMASDHRAANDIRSLIAAVLASRGPDASRERSVSEWAAWATSVADRTDPIARLQFADGGRASLIEPELPQAAE